jgi:hypothetical protein
MEQGPLIIAVLGFLSAVVGLVTALVGRRKEVVHRHESTPAREGEQAANASAGTGSVIRWLGCSAFVVGAGLFLLAVGSYLFLAKSQQFPEVTTSVDADRQVTVTVRERGKPVPNADVKLSIWIGFGRFVGGNDRFITGVTDGQGVFKAHWVPDRADSYGTCTFRATVTIAGRPGEFSSNEATLNVPQRP